MKYDNSLPRWATPPLVSAVATDKGWIDSNTEELLVSHKGLIEKLKVNGYETSAKDIENKAKPAVETKQETASETVQDEKPKRGTVKRKVESKPEEPATITKRRQIKFRAKREQTSR